MKSIKCKACQRKLAEIHRLKREAESQERVIRSLRTDKMALAMLASEIPQFDNPLVAFEIQKMRDELLQAAGRQTK